MVNKVEDNLKPEENATSLVEEMVGNAKVVKAFGYEDDAEARMEEINQRLRD